MEESHPGQNVKFLLVKASGTLNHGHFKGVHLSANNETRK
jgi:hypothetical protein